MSFRKAIPPAIHFPQEESEEEADGFLLIMYVCEVPL